MRLLTVKREMRELTGGVGNSNVVMFGRLGKKI